MACPLYYYSSFKYIHSEKKHEGACLKIMSLFVGLKKCKLYPRKIAQGLEYMLYPGSTSGITGPPEHCAGALVPTKIQMIRMWLYSFSGGIYVLLVHCTEIHPQNGLGWARALSENCQKWPFPPHSSRIWFQFQKCFIFKKIKNANDCFSFVELGCNRSGMLENKKAVQLNTIFPLVCFVFFWLYASHQAK